MRSRQGISPLLMIGALALSGCADDAAPGDAGGGAGGPGPYSGPTFHADVEPLLQQSCVGCHSPGKIAPFNLVSYEDARATAGLIARATRDRTMPPWGAFETDECQPRHGWKDDLRLSEEQIAMLEAWSAAGAPKGDPAAAPPPIPPGDAGLPGMQMELAPEIPYVTSGKADQFRCFVLDPKLATRKYLNGWNFVAGNAKVVHHALMYLDRSGASAALADADGGYDCFGGLGIGGELIAAWAPGGVPFELEPNIGTEIPAGSKMVMQIHYHPAGATADPDATRFQMRFTSAPPEYIALFALLGNYGGPQSGGDGLQPGTNDTHGVQFRIPANAADHVESMRFTLPATIDNGPMPELFLYGAATHMHYVGTDMKIELEHAGGAGQPAEECLLQTPAWDFSWQRAYNYKADIQDLPRFLPGDVLKMRCTYNNTTDNPFVVRALQDLGLPSPIDVYLGESTLDEMCLSALSVLYRNQ